jgi:AbrB family looped-hinge helix DNA binding protein
MKTTITIDNAGRIVIPKSVRERMRLTKGSQLELDVVGDRIELRQKVGEARVERRGKLRVVMGGELFDAGQAVVEDREDRLRQLDAKTKSGRR